ncbi:hypothetical protein AB0C96_14835 [Streptomyces sp. NPDC048506]|uniref:YncE family protein n=1 Tax=Streptomyces sp. NPDC048506 TaxID=3155028 RepID=UPI00344AC762
MRVGAYVANFGSDSVSVINAQVRQVIAVVRVGPLPHSITTVPGGRAYVTENGGGTVTVLDPDSHEHRVAPRGKGLVQRCPEA